MPNALIQKLSNKDWRLEHLYKIVNKESRLVVFKLNSIQEKFNTEKHNRNIILKARQQGLMRLEP